MRRWWAWLVQRFVAASADEDADDRALDIRAFRARYDDSWSARKVTLPLQSDPAADANAPSVRDRQPPAD